MKIHSLHAREILDSSGNPTIETELLLSNGSVGFGSVPSGSSTGSREAYELRDNDPHRFNGRGILKAVENVEKNISKTVVGKEFKSQEDLDKTLIDLDGTDDKSNLGANAILSVSIAYAHASANAKNVELYESLSRDDPVDRLPKPMMVLIEGGAHADNSTDFQEYLIKPSGIKSAKEQIRACQEVRARLAEALKASDLSSNVGLEGAFAPAGISDNQKPLELIESSIKDAGYQPGDEISLAMDVAASEFYQEDHYKLETSDLTLASEDMIKHLLNLVSKFPISSIEDGLAETDHNNWPKLKSGLDEEKVKCVGDDLTVTNPNLIERFAKDNAISAVIIKMNQIGTISETLEAIRVAKEHNLEIIVSHRGSETTDTTLVDLAVATGADYIKVGPTRGERTIKYNRLMKIEELLSK